MLFTLEALNARHGDSLILHFGDAGTPRTILIDGGPATVYNQTLRKRLGELCASRAGDEEPLEIEILMVSHIDDDHVNGVIALMEDLADKVEDNSPLPYRIGTLWHNSFDDIVGPARSASFRQVTEEVNRRPVATGPESGAVAASIDQGRVLRQLAKKLSVPLNQRFDGLVCSADGPGPVVDLDGVKLTILAPSTGRLQDLEKKWDEFLKARAAKEAEKAAEAAAYLDRSVFNLSSIVAVAEAGGRTILLTGDARGDDILKGLKAEGLLKRNRVHFDVLKLPHHGSIRNVEADFFERVTADHYVVSADGRHGNPEVKTLQLISDARGSDDFTIHLTNRESRLVKFFKDEKAKGKKYGVEFRKPSALSMKLDLGTDPLSD
ncbi:MAG TPA: hypothetical protein VHL54_12335 [Actinomycetota bacterium]|nr:hypothetical protein [Actinomycetota bacterium]